jgi:hypothetical protein
MDGMWVWGTGGMIMTEKNQSAWKELSQCHSSLSLSLSLSHAHARNHPRTYARTHTQKTNHYI